ncbi:glucose-6-phosphate isomerase [Texas Phoenix palm phytoplasma]|uniref:Glucose-6-phosphate isomerase n=1 Tax=Texas Phoenix palm phytoplasma TaxID=176709 RepID=A0ABS5BIT8_9MOLU|nr:glucose-6-phosphate isomerase [Texas Phoenix palm phytoplasma]MBP3059488.1 glucose-6-phosphate isomerase [Texas Phoenix palm phytoplasma]
MSFKIDFKGILNFFDFEKEKIKLKPAINKIHNLLHCKKKSEYTNFLGWLNLPLYKDEQEIKKIKELKKKNSHLDVLVVIGIGGSYLGAKAGIEFLKKPFSKRKPEIIFAGYQLSGNYLSNLIEYLSDKEWAINVISKSGTTLEPAIAFRILKQKLEMKYVISEEVKKRIFITTDSKKGNLYQMSLLEGYDRFVIPESIGGRYSVLTSVGLLPFVFAGLNIDYLLKGAKAAYNDFCINDVQKNLAYQYAIARYCLYSKLNKKIELLVNYDDQLFFFSEWWKQLFAESEGKKEQGIFVGSLNYTSDLHSLGQFIQEGNKIMFETILNIKEIEKDCIIPNITNELDNLNFLSGKNFSLINQTIIKSVKQSHIEGFVPNIEIQIDKKNEYNLGYLFYFFQKSCAMSSFLFNVNPFDQPGVEVYKRKMFSFLNKL